MEPVTLQYYQINNKGSWFYMEPDLLSTFVELKEKVAKRNAEHEVAVETRHRTEDGQVCYQTGETT